MPKSAPDAVGPLADEGLVRAMGTRALTLSVVNMIIGAGIFVLPALVARRLGAAAIVAYLVCAVAIGLVLLCFAEAGSRVARSGGVYGYVEVAFGPYAGFLVGNLLWFACGCLACASVANALVGTLAQVVPLIGQGIPRVAFIGLLYASLAWANVRGVRTGAGVVQIVTAGKLAPLLLLIPAGLLVMHAENLRWPGFPSAARVGEASLVLIYAFAGTETALQPSGEVRDPARTVPRSVLTALGIATVLYLALQTTAQGVLGSELAINDKAPLAMVAERALGAGGRLLVLAGAAISMFGYVSGDVLATPRTLFGFARDRLLPAGVAAVHPRYRTPYVAIMVYSAITGTLAMTGSFERLLILANVASLVVYLACALATLELRRRGVRLDAPPLELPGGPLIPLLACGIVLWLFSRAEARELLAVAAMLGVATVLFLTARRRRRVPAAGATG
jgi:basic amino acid/polyamine antiporter, APA family